MRWGACTPTLRVVPFTLSVCLVRRVRDDVAIVLNIARWIIVIYVYVGIQAQREGLAADAARRPCCKRGAAGAKGICTTTAGARASP